MDPRGGQALLPGNSRRSQPQFAPIEIHIGHEEQFLHGRSCKALEEVTQGGDEVSIPGGVQEITGSGT